MNWTTHGTLTLAQVHAFCKSPSPKRVLEQQEVNILKPPLLANSLALLASLLLANVEINKINKEQETHHGGPANTLTKKAITETSNF